MDNKKFLELIKQLEGVEAFQAWRDQVAKPTIEMLEAELASKDIDSIPEIVLRSKLKHLNSLKSLFYDVFRQARDGLKDLEAQEEKEIDLKKGRKT